MSAPSTIPDASVSHHLPVTDPPRRDLAAQAPDLATAFMVWLTMPVEHRGRDTRPSAGVAHLLASLVTSTEPLPEEGAIMLALPPRTSVGEACALLLWAVQDPTGPRCQSFGAAVRFLHQRFNAAVPPAVAATTTWRDRAQRSEITVLPRS